MRTTAVFVMTIVIIQFLRASYLLTLASTVSFSSPPLVTDKLGLPKPIKNFKFNVCVKSSNALCEWLASQGYIQIGLI